MSYRNVEGRSDLSNTLPDRPLPLFTAQRLSLLPTAQTRGIGVDLSLSLRTHQQALAVLSRDPFFEQSLLQDIDKQTNDETESAFDQRQVSCDCLIVGTGPAGVTLAARIRELMPDVRLWMVDERDYRGGMFADPGYDYLLNVPRDGQLGFPGELSDPNNLGSGAFLQLKDITDDGQVYIPRKRLATCLQVDGFIAAPAAVATRVMSVNIASDPSSPYIVHASSLNTGQRLDFNPAVVVFARGRGKPQVGLDLTRPDTQEAFARRRDNIYIDDAFNAHIESLSALELYREIERGLAFIGAGDSTSTALDGILAKLLRAYSPEQIKALHIDVYGAKYTNCFDFEPTVRIPRYNALIPYIGPFIRPHKEKAQELLVAGNNSVGITTATSLGLYRKVAIMTGSKNVPFEQLVNGANVSTIDVLGDEELQGEVIAQQIEGERVFSVGVDVPETFPGRPPVFYKSIVRHTPRILALADRIVDILQAA